MNFNMETMVSLSFMINVVLIIFVYRIHKHTDRMSRQVEQVWSFLWDDIQNKKNMGKM